MLETVSIILGALVVILGYTTFNLLRKVEKSEDIIISYEEYLSKLTQQIEYSEQRLKEIDNKGMFEGDDEIGWFFNEVKKLQNTLSQFKINQ
jgi:hypothetical protein